MPSPSGSCAVTHKSPNIRLPAWSVRGNSSYYFPPPATASPRRRIASPSGESVSTRIAQTFARNKVILRPTGYLSQPNRLTRVDNFEIFFLFSRLTLYLLRNGGESVFLNFFLRFFRPFSSVVLLLVEPLLTSKDNIRYLLYCHTPQNVNFGCARAPFSSNPEFVNFHRTPCCFWMPFRWIPNHHLREDAIFGWLGHHFLEVTIFGFPRSWLSSSVLYSHFVLKAIPFHPEPPFPAIPHFECPRPPFLRRRHCCMSPQSRSRHLFYFWQSFFCILNLHFLQDAIFGCTLKGFFVRSKALAFPNSQMIFESSHLSFPVHHLNHDADTHNLHVLVIFPCSLQRINCKRFSCRQFTRKSSFSHSRESVMWHRFFFLFSKRQRWKREFVVGCRNVKARDYK